MNPFETFANAIRKPVTALTFGSTTAAMLAAYELERKLRPQQAQEQEQLLERYKSAWIDISLRIFRTKVICTTKVTHARDCRNQARLILSNHRAVLDIPVLLQMFGGYVLSRADLAQWPLLGRIAHIGGTIFVEREDQMSRVAAARAIRRKLASGVTMIVFPEGTTYEGDDVHEFHAGVFATLRGLNVEIIPVGLAYDPGAEYGNETFTHHLERTSARKVNRVAVTIGPSQQLQGTAVQQANQARNVIQTLVHDSRRLLQSQ